MDYQEVIGILRLKGGLEISGKPKRVAEFFDALSVAVSGIRELKEYKQIGTLDEVREAVEKQRECKYCEYKTHSEIISELNSCNDCGLVNICEKRPEYGQYCRINCYDWRCRNER